MVSAHLMEIVAQYRYPILLPLGFIEGHIISLVAGALARLGFLNPFLAGACIATGNLLGDIGLYWLGYYKGERLIKKHGTFLGITDETFVKAQKLFHQHRSGVLLVSKLTNGFGFAMAILFSAGATKIPFRSFMFWNVVGEIFWTGALISVGYFFGGLYASIGRDMNKVFIVTSVIVLAGIAIMKVQKIVVSKFSA